MAPRLTWRIMIQSESNYSDHVFKDLDLSAIQVSRTTFLDCTFQGCDLTETVFSHCRFVNCQFKDCNGSLFQVPGCSFSSCRFLGTRLVGVNWSQANWPDSEIGEPLEFQQCSLNHSTFIGAKLGSVKIRRCEAINVDFREASLSEADFSFSDLRESLFQGTDLSKADFRYARNYHIDPLHNKILKAKFSLPEALSLLYSMDIEIEEQ